jgi:hypothetical protein
MSEHTKGPWESYWRMTDDGLVTRAAIAKAMGES